METICINVKALSVHDNKNGTFTLEIPARPLTNETLKLLEVLFPNLMDSAFKLINQEFLLASLATAAEVQAKPVERKY